MLLKQLEITRINLNSNLLLYLNRHTQKLKELEEKEKQLNYKAQYKQFNNDKDLLNKKDSYKIKQMFDSDSDESNNENLENNYYKKEDKSFKNIDTKHYNPKNNSTSNIYIEEGFSESSPNKSKFIDKSSNKYDDGLNYNNRLFKEDSSELIKSQHSKNTDKLNNINQNYTSNMTRSESESEKECRPYNKINLNTNIPKAKESTNIQARSQMINNNYNNDNNNSSSNEKHILNSCSESECKGM